MHNRSGWGVRGDDAIDATAVLPCPLHGVRRILRRHERDDGRAGTGDERLAGSRTQAFLDRLSATRMQGDRRLLQVVLIAIAGTDLIECGIHFRRAQFRTVCADQQMAGKPTFRKIAYISPSSSSCSMRSPKPVPRA